MSDERWIKESEILSGDPEAMPKRIKELETQLATLTAEHNRLREALQSVEAFLLHNKGVCWNGPQERALGVIRYTLRGEGG